MCLSCVQINIADNLRRADFTTDDLQFLMGKHTQQIGRIEQMIVEQRVGLVLIKADEFYRAALPYPKQVIEMIGVYLPPVAIEKNERMQKTVRVR